MSLQVNMEPGGIIWQARQLMATSPGVQPLDKNADDFFSYAHDIIFERKRRDGLDSDQTKEYFAYLQEESINNPIGRLLVKQEELPNGKITQTRLTLLNEALGIMPDYEPATEPGVRKIGRAVVMVHNLTQRYHLSRELNHQQPGLAAGFDILTNGRVHVGHIALATCRNCYYVNSQEENRILKQLQLEPKYIDRELYQLPYVEKEEIALLKNQQLSDAQVSGLQSLLVEQFSPSADL